jgi:hypothetical protein
MATLASGDPSAVRVFISYTHEYEAHNDRILALSQRLRTAGVECIMDQYEMMPDVGWPRWMINQIQAARFVLVVCTPKYHRRFAGVEPGGAQWEGAVITQELYDANGRNTKFVPVGFEPHERNSYVPAILRPWTYYNVATEAGYEDLYRLVTAQPKTIPNSIGQVERIPTASALDESQSKLKIRPLDLTRDKPRL